MLEVTAKYCRISTNDRLRIINRRTDIMKKIWAIALAGVLAASLTACGSGSSASTETTQAATQVQTQETTTEAETTVEETTAAETEEALEEGVMSYDEYMAAELDSEVTVVTYVQTHTSWWQGKVTIYGQSPAGATFIYDMDCTEEEAAKLVPGTKIKVTGYKSEWSGEIEITDATFEIQEGSWIAEAEDVTAMLGTEELSAHMNELVAFKGLTVEPSTDKDGNEVAYLYKWDGSGSEGDDVYFNVSDENGEIYQFLVRSYITPKDTDVYKTALTLEVGDELDMEGFLYWYEGPNPHITSITKVE